MPRKKEGQNKRPSYSASYLTSRGKTAMSRREEKEETRLSKSFPSLEVNDKCVNLTPHNKFYHNPSYYFGIKQHPNTAFHLLVKIPKGLI